MMQPPCHQNEQDHSLTRGGLCCNQSDGQEFLAALARAKNSLPWSWAMARNGKKSAAHNELLEDNISAPLIIFPFDQDLSEQ